MSAEAEAAGTKREREEDDHAEDAPDAKEARVDSADAADAEAPAPEAAEPAAEDKAAEPAAEEDAGPSSVDQLAEALEMLAPVVTKRLDQLHASGLVSEEEIDAQTLLLLGEFTPKVAVEIIDQLTKENLEVRTPARRSPEPAPAREIARTPRAHSSRSFFFESARDDTRRAIRLFPSVLPFPGPALTYVPSSSSPRHLRASRTRTRTSRS